VDARPQPPNPLESRLVYELPERLTEVNHWHKHTPFAFFLVEVLEPRRIVELGTWKGDSYCCLCQAVDVLGIEARATAVDLWQGDAQTGEYGPDVLDELRAFHDPRFGRFSELLRASFDDARAQVPDATVDLLHIDGYHRYEAVRHDFESWLPKLSDRGVVLLHDTSVRDGDFGVWRLWEEIAPRYPSFAFPHGNGLGVLAVGANADRGLVAFLRQASSDSGVTERLFKALGERVAAIGRERNLRASLGLPTASTPTPAAPTPWYRRLPSQLVKR
jgi:Methyltransferase domain